MKGPFYFPDLTNKADQSHNVWNVWRDEKNKLKVAHRVLESEI